VHLAAAARDGRLIQQERKYGAIGREQVRRASVFEALTMLDELAEQSKSASSSG
jgi:nicotinamide-nucleotide amidase